MRDGGGGDECLFSLAHPCGVTHAVLMKTAAREKESTVQKKGRGEGKGAASRRVVREGGVGNSAMKSKAIESYA